MRSGWRSPARPCSERDVRAPPTIGVDRDRNYERPQTCSEALQEWMRRYQSCVAVVMKRLKLGSLTGKNSRNSVTKELFKSFILHLQAELIVESSWCELLKPTERTTRPLSWARIFLPDADHGADPGWLRLQSPDLQRTHNPLPLGLRALTEGACSLSKVISPSRRIHT